MTKDEALKMAIDDSITKFINDVSDDNDSDSTWQSYAVQAAEMIRIRIQNACKDALEQPAQKSYEQSWYDTHPAPSWQGLSDDEIEQAILSKNKAGEWWGMCLDIARAIETKLKEKNHGI